ncbi:3'-5' exonuclease [Gloeothece verrucosa]|uniref:Exonuclease RNase T and DNA polymerase III n=1 Tax=Gloeothece verrucosa (strain PCC 7822) TaxID=497965 RepID=E0UNL3_GLOV7|nr:3'-5' exonuclease [Gloeothece verrucosa]ADN18543.1 Exonuclease RNase T and DNA polymerase III [Gloeothece verrucosa PCC 7822]
MIEVETCLIIDSETDGDKDHPKVLEVGAVLYSVTGQCMLSCGSSLIATDADSNQAYWINKIVPEATQLCPQQQQYFLNWLQAAYSCADVIVAHNANFDKEVIKKSTWAQKWDKIWLCTYKDFELFPKQYNGKRDLISLSQFYGIGISCTHRAIDDCLLLKEVFNRVPNLSEQFRIAQLPLVEAIAPKKINGLDNEAVLSRGFRWDPDCAALVKKDRGETFDFPVIPYSSDRKKFKALVSFDNRQKASDWGFSWKPETKTWWRLLNPYMIDFFPFPVAELHPDPEAQDHLINA